MVFSDLFFLFVFLPSCALLYLLAGLIDRKSLQPNGRPVNTLKNAVLVLFSLIFYAWGEPVYVFLMLGCVLWNYLGGLALTRFEQYRGFALFLGVVGNLAILGTFKYAGLIADTLTSWGIPVSNPHIALPIGVSFYTFQSMSYLIDVYRRESPVQKSFGNLLLYVSMFPQLVAGPIVRYSTVAAQIQDRRVTAQDFAEGVYRFLIGLGKKVILANQFSEIVSQFLGGNLQNLTTSGAWLGILAFTFQIYFDFSGYSDMAIGMGRCLGFHFTLLGFSLQRKLCASLHQPKHHRVLAQMAHFFGKFLPRLRLHSPRGQSPSPVIQHPCRVVLDGSLARCELEFRALGNVFRRHRDARKIHAVALHPSRATRAAPSLQSTPNCGGLGYFLL